jgi:hypothetical protein
MAYPKKTVGLDRFFSINAFKRRTISGCLSARSVVSPTDNEIAGLDKGAARIGILKADPGLDRAAGQYIMGRHRDHQGKRDLS